jgi:N-hydroxyarylamine O-acetyltransferase
MISQEAYAARIGYTGSWSPSLATLQKVHALHPAAIPFENIDPFVGRPVPLDLRNLEQKLLLSRRGGYCFEQNTLLKAVLEQAGFSVESLAARVLWRSQPGAPVTPRTHMLLKVGLQEGAYIADTGYGGYLVAAPLRLVPNIEQETPGGVLRLLQSERDAFTLQAKIASAWRNVYVFTLEPQAHVDFEVANWFTSTHPNSRFLSNLLMERLTPEARVSLFNRTLTRRHRDGRVEEIVLDNPRQLEEALTVDFDVESPVDAGSLFERLPPP